MRGSAFGNDDHDNYLASVSDLVIGLLFIFIIILMAFGLYYREAETAQLDALEELTLERDALGLERDDLRLEAQDLAVERRELVRTTEALAAVTALLEARDDRRHQLLETISAYLSRRGVDVLIEPENGILRLPEGLLFDTGEARLRPEGERAIDLLADVMLEVMPCYSRAPQRMQAGCEGDVTSVLEAVLVEGHTDQRPINTEEFRDNWELGAIRGINTFRALIDAQPALEQLRNPSNHLLLGVSSYEARRPVADPSSAEGRARNRRIDLRFITAGPTAAELAELRARIEAAQDEANLDEAGDGARPRAAEE